MDHHQQKLAARGARGMTLVEAVMSLAILTIVLLVASQLTMSMNMVSAEESAETQIQTDLRRAMSELVFILEESRPVAMWREDQIAAELPHLPRAPDNTYNYNQNEDLLDRGMVFTFTVPLKQVSGTLLRKPTNSTEIFDHGEVFYGAGDMGLGSTMEYVPGDPLLDNNTYSVFFLPNGEVLDEAVEQVDMDSNGVMTDRFIYGGLFVANDATAQIRQITGRIAVKRFMGLPTIYTNSENDQILRRDDPRGKAFFLEAERFRDRNDNGVYDKRTTDDFEDTGNENRIWDVKMIIRFYFPMITQDSRRGRVTRLRAIETRINYFRNSFTRTER